MHIQKHTAHFTIISQFLCVKTVKCVQKNKLLQDERIESIILTAFAAQGYESVRPFIDLGDQNQ